MKTKNYLLIGVILGILNLFVGGWLGFEFRKSQEVPCPTIDIQVDSFIIESKDTINLPVPYCVSGDIIHDTIMAKVDTALILHDYFKSRKYNFDFSTDSTGTFKINITVSKNQIEEVISDIKAKVKMVTVTKTEYMPKVPFAQVFATIGSDTKFTTQKAQLGIDFKQKYIIGATGIRYMDKFSYTIDVGIKF